ncbi:MAG: hypothetical protein AAFX06_33100 [Planctomycetota bacterium]
MRSFFIATLSIALLPIVGLTQSDINQPPISYESTKGDNPITRLFDGVRAGETTLSYRYRDGHLKSILSELGIPVSSQCLVFSKTSLQSARISPQNPRAIYFNDDVYVGWVQGSSLLEIATADPALGTAYYTVRMNSGGAAMRRHNSACLACHLTSKKQGRIPGHSVRSVMTRESGKINLLLPDFKTTHASPFEERWGGWYVTGDVGEMKHRGNAFLEGETLVPEDGGRRSDLTEDFESSRWPIPHSDVVALMVFEHQTFVHNELTRAHYDIRRARHVGDEDAVRQAIETISERLVDALLLSDEAALSGKVTGSTSFSEEFAARGPFDRKGRSLREFDLSTRLFRYPCSYLIYSSSFEVLDAQLKTRVYERMLDRLISAQPQDKSRGVEINAAIIEILRDTKTDLPESWVATTDG